MQEFQSKLIDTLAYFEEKLIRKNTAYGDAALNPLNVFSKNSAVEQLKTSIDHKLSRIKNVGLNGDGTEDSLDDLIGYLILLKIELNKNKQT